MRPDTASAPIVSRSVEPRYEAPPTQDGAGAAIIPVAEAAATGPAFDPAVDAPAVDAPAVADLPAASREEVARTPGDHPKVLVNEPEPPPPGLPEDMHYLWDVWQREKPGARGVLERSRGARILEGPTPEGDAPTPALAPAPAPALAPAPAKLKRLAREPAKDPSPEIAASERHGAERPEAQAPDPRSAQHGAMRIARLPAEPTAVEIATPQLEVAPKPAAGVPEAPEPTARHDVSRAPANPLRVVARIPDSEARRDGERPAPASVADLERPATPPPELRATASPGRPAQRPAAVPVRLARRPAADNARVAAENETARPRLRRAAVASPPHLTVVRSPVDASPAAPAEPTRPQSRSLLSRIFRRATRDDAAVGQAREQLSAVPIATPPPARVGQIAQRAGGPLPVRTASRPATAPDRPIARVSRRAGAQAAGPSVLSRQFGLPTPTLPTIPSSGFEAAASGEAHAAASNLGMPTHAPSAPALHAPGAPSLDPPGASSFHPPGTPSLHPPGASSFQPPSAPPLQPPQIPSPAMPSLAGHHGLPSIGGAAAHALGGHAAAPQAGGNDPGSDDMYRELLSRLREEQEQLGQIVDEPF